MAPYERAMLAKEAAARAAREAAAKKANAA